MNEIKVIKQQELVKLNLKDNEILAKFFFLKPFHIYKIEPNNKNDYEKFKCKW